LEIYLKKEKSAGFLIFRRENNTIKYLFLKSKGRYDIPKGIQEVGESEFEAALRELKEETGINEVKIVPLFKKKIEYFYRLGKDNIKKEVVYFLGEVNTSEIKISKEHNGYEWLTKEEVLSKVKYENIKKLVEEAENYIKNLNKKNV
jgi:8-oxo-dGTP pyrophosphatase MutT (NUDIX family)